MKFKRRTQNELGFTLIEVIVSTAIVVIIGIGVVAFERSVLMNTKVLQAELSSQQQVRKTLSGFVSDVRAASPSAAGAYAIDTAATSTLIFYANIDSDVSIERIRYFFATSTKSKGAYDTLKRGVTKPTGTTYNTVNEKISSLVSDVSNGTSSPIFTYYDTGYDGFTSSSSDPLPVPINIPLIRLIKMSLTTNPNGIRSPVMQTYSSQVSIRNLKDNL